MYLGGALINTYRETGLLEGNRRCQPADPGSDYHCVQGLHYPSSLKRLTKKAPDKTRAESFALSRFLLATVRSHLRCSPNPRTGRPCGAVQICSSLADFVLAVLLERRRFRTRPGGGEGRGSAASGNRGA